MSDSIRAAPDVVEMHIKIDHSKESLHECLGISDERKDFLAKEMTKETFKIVMSDESKPSHLIEACAKHSKTPEELILLVCGAVKFLERDRD